MNRFFLLIAVLIFLGACESKESLRVCYFSTWARYRVKPFDMQPEDVDPTLCTHVILAFAWITEGNLTLQTKKEDQPLIFALTDLKRRNPDLKVLAAVGGWNFGSEPFKKVTATRKSRIQFVKSTVGFLHHWRLDGLDLDWEYPDWADRNKFTMLVKLLNKAFLRDSKRNTKEKFLLTAAVTAASSKMGGYDVEAIKGSFDFINVMTYDLNGPWANMTGHNAALESMDSLNVRSGVSLWEKAGMPKDKIVVGIPLYGHSFKLIKDWSSDVGTKSLGGVAGPITKEKGFFAYYEVCQFISDPNTEVFWDEQAKVPYAVNNDTWVSYDNEASVKLKVDWTLSHGYGGIMVWSLAMDDFSGQICRPNTTFPLLKSINVAMGVNTTEYSEPDYDYENMITVSQRRKSSWRPEESWVSESENGQPGSTPQEWDKGSECDWTSIKPHKSTDCTHFLVCERGYLHEFQCPLKLAFNEKFGICMWPWEVKGCEYMTKLDNKDETDDEKAKLQYASEDNLSSSTEPPLIESSNIVPYEQEHYVDPILHSKRTSLQQSPANLPNQSTPWPERIFHTVSPMPHIIKVVPHPSKPPAAATYPLIEDYNVSKN